MKKRILTIVVLLGLIIAVCFSLPAIFRPSMPITWQKVHRGITRDQVINAVGELNDVRELKGFDTRSEHMTAFGDPCYWLLEITYDKAGTVATAEAWFIDRNCGLFNTKRKALF